MLFNVSFVLELEKVSTNERPAPGGRWRRTKSTNLRVEIYLDRDP